MVMEITGNAISYVNILGAHEGRLIRRVKSLIFRMDRVGQGI